MTMKGCAEDMKTELRSPHLISAKGQEARAQISAVTVKELTGGESTLQAEGIIYAEPGGKRPCVQRPVWRRNKDTASEEKGPDIQSLEGHIRECGLHPKSNTKP